MKYVKTNDGIYYVPTLLFQDPLNCKCEHGMVIKQANTIQELCDEFEVIRKYDGYTFKYTSYEDAYNRWFGDGYQGVSDDMYGLVNGKRVAVMTGYDEGKHPNKIEMELLWKRN